MPTGRFFIRPLILFLLITLVLILLSGLSTPWKTWRPATCLPEACFCEAIGNDFIRQPIDTWSNLAFVLVGLFILEDITRRMNLAAAEENTLKRVSTRFRGAYPASICPYRLRCSRGPLGAIDGHIEHYNLLQRYPIYGIIYACAVMLLGLGSWFYHASLTFVGQWFDVMGMYLLGTFMVLYNVARLRPFSGRAFTGSYVLFNLALGISLIVVPELRRYLFGVLLLVTIALEVLLRQSRRNRGSPFEGEWMGESRNPVSKGVGYFIAALLIYLLAQLTWTLDLNHIVCDPQSLLQGHAVWHVLTALSAAVLYWYYRSEEGVLEVTT